MCGTCTPAARNAAAATDAAVLIAPGSDVTFPFL